MNVLVIDVGGTHVKILATGQTERREFPSGPALTARAMVSRVKKLAGGWKYDAISIGYPGPVLHGQPVAEPHNLAPGWVAFDYHAAFKRPVKIINDAAMQALGSYRRGKMLFLGLGTGLGSSLIVDGIVEPMELSHLPYKKATFEDYVGLRGLEKRGKKKWRKSVADVVARLIAALLPDDVVLGGGNVKNLKKLPPGCRAGENANAFRGGFRLWEKAAPEQSSTPRAKSSPVARKKINSTKVLQKKSSMKPAVQAKRVTKTPLPAQPVAKTKSTTLKKPAPSLPKIKAIKMRTPGYNQPLYVLPFDHRGSFETKMFGWHGDLTPEQTAEIAAAKQVIYDGFKAAVAAGVPKEKAGILVDEQFGAAILHDASANGFHTACPAEKSGQDEFDFEYGDDFAKHIETFHPTFCKVLVRYNPEGVPVLNQRQTTRLKKLSDYLRSKSKSRFMFELLVPAEPAQLERLNGDKQAYDRELRPKLMVQTIEQLQDAGVEPDVWKIEGLERRDDCERIVVAAHRGGRDQVGCIVLGRGENDQKVHEWLTIASGVKGFIGFAVGRTDFWQALVDFRTQKISREAAIAEIARRYREFVGIFEKARPS
jgi:myo-inositol catabolism protein IolC/predicted NBD/HSP70 family sugar kinase